MSRNHYSRRHFLRNSSTAAFTTASGLPMLTGGAEAKKWPWEFCTFTKPLQNLSFDQCSKIIADSGFDGVEAPVRPRGQVLPEKVADQLPLFAESLKKHQLNFTLLTSGINEVNAEQYTEEVLRTAADLGVTRFRMAYYRYNLDQPIYPQLANFKAKLKDLIALTDEIGIKPIYQNHSGSKYFGAPIWDLHEVISDYKPEQVGVAFDIGHAWTEGTKAWPLNYRLVLPYIDTIYIKEPHWINNKQTWGPIGEGVFDGSFFSLLKRSNFDGPISIHAEYLSKRSPEEFGPALKQDLDAVKNQLK